MAPVMLLTQGVVRRADICKARYTQLAKMPADPSEAGPEGQLLEGGLSVANISKQQAKEIMLRSLPVSEGLLRRHQEVLAPLALKLLNKRHQVRCAAVWLAGGCMLRHGGAWHGWGPHLGGMGACVRLALKLLNKRATGCAVRLFGD